MIISRNFKSKIFILCEYWQENVDNIRFFCCKTDFSFLLGLLCDLLWSDPDKEVQGWGENDRGVSFTFGADIVAKFLHKHDLDLICRAHQVELSFYDNFLSFMPLAEM